MIEILKTEEEKLMRIIETCNCELANAPEGFLYIKKRAKRIDCYQAVNYKLATGQWKQKRIYIKEDDQEKIAALQHKKLRKKQMTEAKEKLRAIQRCKKAYAGTLEDNYVKLLGSKYGEMVTYNSKNWDSEIMTWMEKKEQYNQKHKEKKLFMTRNGIAVRSKSELLIADALESYNIPYKYDVVLKLPGQWVSPDFLILRPYDKKEFAWEHYGLIGNKIYEANAEKKKLIYKMNGFCPWDNLIETYDNEEGVIDIRMIDTLIRGTFLI